MPQINLYGKPGCSLCDEAYDEIESVRKTEPFDFNVIRIDTDAALMEEYSQRIPVITLNGNVIFEYFVDAARLRQLLKEVKE